jgi:hypothetical protein
MTDAETVALALYRRLTAYLDTSYETLQNYVQMITSYIESDVWQDNPQVGADNFLRALHFCDTQELDIRFAQLETAAISYYEIRWLMKDLRTLYFMIKPPRAARQLFLD